VPGHTLQRQRSAAAKFSLKGDEMRIYLWDSSERKFTPALDYTPPSECALMMSLTIGKGEQVTGRPTPSEQMICLLKGAWHMKIADEDLVVRRNEAVVIPSGFEHSAVAIEDSFALQVVSISAPIKACKGTA
jgi:quercetin dioxygenase-like cupin family protein